MNSTVKRAKKRKLAKRCGCKCAYCGKAMGLHKLTLDHSVPRCLGGGNQNYNLKLACRDCNQRKADKPPHVWHAELCGAVA